MAEDFSFSESDIELIIRNTGNLVLINKVMSVYFSEKANRIKAIEVESPFMPRNFSDIPIDERTYEEIEVLRNNNEFDYFWYSSQDIPFATKVKKIQQMNVFNENDRHILMIKLKNEADNKNDLIYYYFNKNLSNFKPSDTDTPMDQNNKTVIGLLMYNVANLLASKCRNDRKALKSYNKDIFDIISLLKSNEELNENHYHAFLNYANDIVSDLSSRSGIHTFILSDKAKTKLKTYNGELKAISKILKDGSSVAAKLNVNAPHIPVIIEDYHLHFGDNTVSEIKPSVRMDESKYDKIILWLDRIEEAAMKAIQDKLPLTGANIGKACKKTISAPAISDFLHNNQSRIKSVLKKNPDNWPIIRSEFKPLINVLVSKKMDDEMLDKQA